MQSVERDRESLLSQILTLKHLQDAANISDDQLAPSLIDQSAEANFDDAEDMDEEDLDAALTATHHFAGPAYSALAEKQRILLPCPGSLLGNVEVNLRQIQACRLLNQIRELIAEKSFQYSHVIRASPRKGVRTRASAVVKKLVHNIVLHARLYTHCRSRLLLLGCNAEQMRPFQILRKDDLKASTAILKPNLPGSTNLRLSWIWHNTNTIAAGTGADADADASPDRIWECMCIL
jgi:hypothetical protein